MGKFAQANDIVIQSGFRNPEFKALDTSASSRPSATSDGVSMPKSERCLVEGKATAGNRGRVDVYGLVKSLDEWRWIGKFYADENGGYLFIRGAGPLDRIAVKSSNMDTLNLGYPIDE